MNGQMILVMWVTIGFALEGTVLIWLLKEYLDLKDELKEIYQFLEEYYYETPTQLESEFTQE